MTVAIPVDVQVGWLLAQPKASALMKARMFSVHDRVEELFLLVDEVTREREWVKLDDLHARLTHGTLRVIRGA